MWNFVTELVLSLSNVILKKGFVSRKRWKLASCIVAFMSLLWHSADKICIFYWSYDLVSHKLLKMIIHKRRDDFKIRFPYNHSTSLDRWSDNVKFCLSAILRILRVKGSDEYVLKTTRQNAHKQNLFQFLSRGQWIL